MTYYFIAQTKPMPNKPKNYPFSFYLFKWILVLLICFFALGLTTKPIRKIWSRNYLEKGDNYLEQKKYESAILEYKKASFLYWRNEEVQEKTLLAKKASTDVLVLEEFYKEKNLSSQIDLMAQVKTVPEDEVSAIKLAKEMIAKGEFQYAVIAAKNSTEMDRNYRDGWLYLGIANLDCARMLGLSSSAGQKYEEEAKKALEKARGIDPEYQPTKDYIVELEKIK